MPVALCSAALREYFKERPNYPPELLGDVPHTHKPIDDARGHAALYFNARRRIRPEAASGVGED